MKKLWVAAGVLAVLLALGIVSTLVMERVHGELSEALEKAALLSESDWETANALANSARAKWEKSSHMIAALADHEPLEELDGLFAELAVCQRQADQRCFAAVCVRIASLAQMLQESHTPYWWNLL
jgi:microcompartment protein CcmL/EutN